MGDGWVRTFDDSTDPAVLKSMVVVQRAAAGE
jgi:hypothetical protein